MLKKFFAYIRVSTTKQGEGVSLDVQKEAIRRYAERHGLEICAWFEEKETAAKRGRPFFNQMMKLLKAGKAQGIIIHKIDRSARNLKDWADLGEMIDRGIEVHFVNESLDLHSRGGRLSADIQAVVAADYIRNLREETKKGFYGRIKQGFLPLPAPTGYLDMGKAKPKEYDPARAPLIRKAFELYSTGRYNLKSLEEEMFGMGLRSKFGNKISYKRLSAILNNPFYIGIIKIEKTGEVFPGNHNPLISKSLFDRVQLILKGKLNARTQQHDFMFRRFLKCKTCGFSLIGERQKSYVYYRCHTKGCPPTCIREESIEQEAVQKLTPLQFSQDEKKRIEFLISEIKGDWEKQGEEALAAFNLRLHHVQDRLNRLTDAYLDQALDKEMFEHRKAALLLERKDLEEKIKELTADNQKLPDRLAVFLELAGTAYSLYKKGIPEEKRDLLKILTSNRVVDGKNVDFTLSAPFQDVANRFENSYGGPSGNIPRTLDRLVEKLTSWFIVNPTAPTLAAPDSFPKFTNWNDKK